MDGQQHTRECKCEIYRDNFQNFKRYGIPKAQLVIADVPYNCGLGAYGSSPQWYIGGDRANGESDKAAKPFFNTDMNFNLVEYMHFCNRLLIKEPKERNRAPAMIVFCAFEQAHELSEVAAKYGFKHGFPIFFIKDYSAQALKANMKIVGATEMAMVFYRDKLPKFRNGGRMVFNWFRWTRDGKEIPKLHPTQKPIGVLKTLISIFTDPGDVVIDPCAGSGSTLRAAYELHRSAYGFEIDRKFYNLAKTRMLVNITQEFDFGADEGSVEFSGVEEEFAK